MNHLPKSSNHPFSAANCLFWRRVHTWNLTPLLSKFRSAPNRRQFDVPVPIQAECWLFQMCHPKIRTMEISIPKYHLFGNKSFSHTGDPQKKRKKWISHSSCRLSQHGTIHLLKVVTRLVVIDQSIHMFFFSKIQKKIVHLILLRLA